MLTALSTASPGRVGFDLPEDRLLESTTKSVYTVLVCDGLVCTSGLTVYQAYFMFLCRRIVYAATS